MLKVFFAFLGGQVYFLVLVRTKFCCVSKKGKHLPYMLITSFHYVHTCTVDYMAHVHVRKLSLVNVWSFIFL